MLLYEYMPFFSGLRDSNKIIGILGLMYALFSGIGVQALLNKIKTKKSLHEITSIVLLAIPMTYGMYMWGGLHNQLTPAYYPHEWKEARATLDSLPPYARILVLPWHSYLSMPFVNYRLVANPLTSYFGSDRVVVGRDVGMGGIHDQEVDEEYRALDTLITHAYMIDGQELIDTLKAYDIYGVLVINNPLIDGSDLGLTKWTEFGEDSKAPVTKEEEKMQKNWTEILPKDIKKKKYGESLILFMFQ
jgi:hypothetical protein